MKWIGVILPFALAIGCGGDGEESASSDFLPTGAIEAAGEEAPSETGASEESEENSTEEASATGDVEQEGICTNGTFACQAGTLSTCEAGQWKVLENCEDPLACNPVDGNCGGCEPDCSNKACGDDGCGNSCGVCGPDAACEQGQCVSNEPEIVDSEEGGSEGSEGSEEPGMEGGGATGEGPSTVECLPNGTGKQVGDYAKNIAWKEASGDWVELHDYCGAEFVVLVESAPW